MSGELRPVAMKNVDDRELEVVWEDDLVTRIRYSDLRAECPCAVCVDEWTGKRILRDDSIEADVRPISIALVGNYAVKFNWSDGHSTGIYTFERLREIGMRVKS